MHRIERDPEAGSAYIIALMALVILSIIGLGLALVTQTEMQIGGGEKTLQKVFYAADTGVQNAVARAIVNKDFSQLTFVLKDNEKTLAGFQHEVTDSPFMPLLNAPCNLCEVNDQGEYGHDQYKKVNFGETPTAVRKNVWKTSDSLGAKTLSTLVEIQPYQITPDALAPILNDPNAASLLKF
jgi:Tfp pilus assembly protein PilX